MEQLQPVPGPSQEAFDALSDHMANFDTLYRLYNDNASGNINNFDYTQYKLILAIVDNNTSACYSPNMIPSKLLYEKSSKSIVFYGSSNSEYVALKLEGTTLSVVYAGYLGNVQIFGIK